MRDDANAEQRIVAVTGWAHEIDGRREAAVEHLQRAVELDPNNDDATARLRRWLSVL
ncbi:MAG TPA: hypothetical protein VFY88_02235 [Intrasporangium sp.]|nr:hypothetical protein [Intrasporangium sp.]